MNIVRINNNGSMNDLKINKPSSQNIILKLNKLSNINDEKIKELYYWKNNSHLIKCYGYYEGDAGFENKHDLLPNGNSTFLEEESSEILLFGDIFIVCFNNKNEIINFSVSDYGMLYEELYDGFDDCSSEDDLSDELDTDEESNHSFIEDNETDGTDDSYDEILDYDKNNYSSSSEEEEN
tara:strand:- start:674 stop:1213 length:540 start_codon:yes stop_codon:yes gene_type:complete